MKAGAPLFLEKIPPRATSPHIISYPLGVRKFCGYLTHEYGSIRCSELSTSDYKLLIYSMVQSPSWAANWFARSQEFLRISRNPKVHYRTHKRPPTVSILGQPNPVHVPTSHLLEIHPKIIHPSTPRSPQKSLSLRFPHQEPIQNPLLPHICHMPTQFHSSRFYRPHNIGWGVQII